ETWKPPSRTARHTCGWVRRCSVIGVRTWGNVPTWTLAPICRIRPPRGHRRIQADSMKSSAVPHHRDDGGHEMAGAMRKMAVYLGLVEDDRYDHRYADEYDDFDDLDEAVEDRRDR